MPKAPQENRLKTTRIAINNAAKVASNVEPDSLKTITIENHMDENEKRPTNLKANVLPTEGYGLEVDGKVKLQFDTAEAATKAGLELKQKYPHIQVKVFDAKERTRTAVELPT